MPSESSQMIPRALTWCFIGKVPRLADLKCSLNALKKLRQCIKSAYKENQLRARGNRHFHDEFMTFSVIRSVECPISLLSQDSWQLYWFCDVAEKDGQFVRYGVAPSPRLGRSREPGHNLGMSLAGFLLFYFRIIQLQPI